MSFFLALFGSWLRIQNKWQSIINQYIVIARWCIHKAMILFFAVHGNLEAVKAQPLYYMCKVCIKISGSLDEFPMKWISTKWDEIFLKMICWCRIIYGTKRDVSVTLFNLMLSVFAFLFYFLNFTINISKKYNFYIIFR